jgi:hypothetical protein
VQISLSEYLVCVAVGADLAAYRPSNMAAHSMKVICPYQRVEVYSTSDNMWSRNCSEMLETFGLVLDTLLWLALATSFLCFL